MGTVTVDRMMLENPFVKGESKKQKGKKQPTYARQCPSCLALETSKILGLRQQAHERGGTRYEGFIFSNVQGDRAITMAKCMQVYI